MIGIIGSGGQAKVIVDIYRQLPEERPLILFTQTITEEVSPFFQPAEVYPDDEGTLLNWFPHITAWHVAIGDPQVRMRKLNWIKQHHGQLISFIHPSAVLAQSVQLGEGTAVMAGAVINPCSIVGQGVIVNTAASVDHDCCLGDGVNIGPGSHLAGGVKIGSLTEIGTGAIILPGVTIGHHCIIGAGAVVTQPIPDHSLAVGVPARVIKTVQP